LNKRLTDAMSSRTSTFKEDMQCLKEVLQSARNPPGLLCVKLREMEDGTFQPKGGGRGRGRDFGASGQESGGGSFGSGGSGAGGGAGMSAARRAELFGSLSRSRKRSKSRARKRDRSRSRKRSRSKKRRSRSRKRDREKDRDKEKDRDRSRSRDGSRGKKRSRSRKGDSDKEKDRGKDRDRKKDRDKDRNKDRSRSRADDRDEDKREKGNDKRRDKDKEKDRDRNREEEGRDEEKEGDKSKDRDRSWDERFGKDSGEARRVRGAGEEVPFRGVEVAPPGPQATKAPEQKQATIVNPDDEVHYGIACGNCAMSPIVGDRFKCSVCESYDLCEACYEIKDRVHVAAHRFFVQKAVVALPPEALSSPSPPSQSAPPSVPPIVPDAAYPTPSPPVPHPQPLVVDPHATALQMQQMMQQMHAMLQQSTQQVAPPVPMDHAPAPQQPAQPAQPAQVAQPETMAELQSNQATTEMPAWLPAHIPCSLCGSIPTDDKPHGVLCFRQRGKSRLGCCQGVCWSCMETRPRAELGMVRTTKMEFASLEDDAWWMHEKCMEKADLRDYYGGEKELALARAAADEEEAGKAVEAKSDEISKEPMDPLEAAKERVRAMSVKELKAYLGRHGVEHSQFLEKSDMVAAALGVAEKSPPEGPGGPAWMPLGMVCRLCTKAVKQEKAGVVCRRARPDGSCGGCGEGVCWRCMKRAPKDSFGTVRCTKEEFESLGDGAWWMHTACFGPGDYESYFDEPEPEGFKATQKALRRRRGEEVSEDEWE